MPRASSSSGGPVLRRNQACRTCRKKKLKCDAARPHCGNCLKAWKGMISVPPPDGYNHPEEPQCSYDPVEGLRLSENVDPVGKIRQLEAENAELKRRLQESGLEGSPSASDISNGARPATIGNASVAAFARPSYHSPEPPPSIALPRAGLEVHNGSISPPSLLPRSNTSSPEQGSSPDIFELVLSGWNADLPEPKKMRQYIEAFFMYDQCASRILHRPSLEASMHFSPMDVRFPHSAILHAICASAARWVNQDPLHVETTNDGIRRDKFADYHSGKTRQYIDRTMASGADIFHVLQACTILSWYFYSEGRWVEVWIFSGFQTRVSIPLRLNFPGTFATSESASPGAFLAPPRDQKELESRRRTWWMSVMFDRIASVGGWPHSIDSRHIATELPLRREDFYVEELCPGNTQSLRSPAVFTTHPPQYTDPYILLIKAVMLFGLVTDFNNDYQLQHPPPRKTDDPTQTSEFQRLDRLVVIDFLASLPPLYRDYLHHLEHATDITALDTDMFLIHLIPHAAAITLHNNYINYTESQRHSTLRCAAAADAILKAYYIFNNFARLHRHVSPPLICRLHPFVTICWYLAAVVKIQECRHTIQVGDAVNELHVWGEINLLRMAMLEFGQLSPVGVRQEKLLMALMEDIVRLTSQDRPLEVVPLYRFSARTAFQGNGTSVDDTGAPLPVSPPSGSEFTTTAHIGVVPRQVPTGWGQGHSPRPGMLHAYANSSPAHSHSSTAHSTGSFV